MEIDQNESHIFLWSGQTIMYRNNTNLLDQTNDSWFINVKSSVLSMGKLFFYSMLKWPKNTSIKRVVNNNSHSLANLSLSYLHNEKKITPSKSRFLMNKSVFKFMPTSFRTISSVVIQVLTGANDWQLNWLAIVLYRWVQITCFYTRTIYLFWKARRSVAI